MIENLDEEQRKRWERLWQVSDSRMANIHPLVYLHPVTQKKVSGNKASCRLITQGNKPKESVFKVHDLNTFPSSGCLQVLCFHLGFVHAYVWDYGSANERWTRSQETHAIAAEIHHEFVKNNGAVQYRHKVLLVYTLELDRISRRKT